MSESASAVSLASIFQLFREGEGLEMKIVRIIHAEAKTESLLKNNIAR